MKKLFIISVLLLSLTLSSLAQLVDPVKWKNTSKRAEGDTIELTFKANIEVPWHLYSQYFDEGGPVRTTFYFDESDKFEVIGKPSESPEPITEFDEVFKINVKYFSKEATFVQKIKVLTNEPFAITGSIEYQVCADDKCVYFNPDFKVSVEGTSAGSEAATLTPKVSLEEMSTELTPVDEETGDDKSIWGFFFLAFVLGLAGVLTPCVFPMIPMTVSFFMQGEQSKFNSIVKALIFGISIVILYTSVGLIVSLTSAGADFTTSLSTHWIPNTIFFVLFVVFAASFFGMFEIILPTGLANKADRQVDKGGFLASFLWHLPW